MPALGCVFAMKIVEILWLREFCEVFTRNFFIFCGIAVFRDFDLIKRCNTQQYICLIVKISHAVVHKKGKMFINALAA